MGFIRGATATAAGDACVAVVLVDRVAAEMALLDLTWASASVLEASVEPVVPVLMMGSSSERAAGGSFE